MPTARRPAGRGAWNMAVDEMLLDGRPEQDGCLLAILSLAGADAVAGILSRRTHDRGNHPASRSCPVVRRLTGGGAILHDAELTYSLVLPGGHPLAARRESLYQAAHAAWSRRWPSFGIVGRRSAGRPPVGRSREPLLCFQRRAAGDVLVGATKIAGSAQRRRRGRRAPARKRAVASFAGRPGTVRLGGRCRKGVRRRRPGPGVARTAGPTACRGLGAGRTIVGGGSPRWRAGPMPLRMPRMDATAGAIAGRPCGDPDVDFGRQSDYIVGMEVKLISSSAASRPGKRSRRPGRDSDRPGGGVPVASPERPRQPPPLRDFPGKRLGGDPRFRQQERDLRQRRAIASARELKNGDHLKIGPLEFEVQLSVSVSGKRKPKVHNVQEAAARTVESAPGEELDVSNWLEDDDEEEARDATTETHSAPSASTTRLPVEKTPQKAAACARAEEETKKTRPGSFLDREPGRKPPKTVARRPPTCSSNSSIAGRDRLPTEQPPPSFPSPPQRRVVKARPTKKSAALLGLAFDNEDGQTRITRGKNFLLCGGTQETHAVMQETAVKINEQA